MNYLNNFKKTFKNKKILITGHTGFKGSWLSLFFNIFEAKVFGISKNIITKPSHYDFIKKIYHDEFKFDLSNPDKCRTIINKIKPDYIFHLAAQSIVSKSKSDPIETIKSNILASANVIDSVLDYNKKIILIMVTSDKVYKNNEWIWGYRENDSMGGEDMYSATKASAELIIKSYKKFILNNTNIKIGIARAGNVIGGGDWTENRIVPDLIKAWHNNKILYVNNIDSIRPWQHVIDPLYGYIKLASFLNKKINSKFPNDFNFGPSGNETYKVKDVINQMTVDLGKIRVSFKKRKFKEHSLLRLDSSLANYLLDWKTQISFEEMCHLTSTWYENFYRKKTPVLDFSKSQIMNFLKNKNL